MSSANTSKAKGYLHWTRDLVPPPSVSQCIGYCTLGLRLHEYSDLSIGMSMCKDTFD